MRPINSAILAAFPTTKSYERFKTQDSKIWKKALPRLLKYLYDQDVIKAPKEKNLIQFIKSESRYRGAKFSRGFSFDNFLKKNNLKFGKKAIKEINEVARLFGCKKITSVMITRLRQDFTLHTVQRRSAARVLLFWIGRKYPEIDVNYEKLLSLQRKTCIEAQGITITFELQNKEGLITENIVNWLSKKITFCVKKWNLPGLNPQHELVSHTKPTAFSINMPKNPGSYDVPRSYDSAIRTALAMSHLLLTEWGLTEFDHQEKISLLVAIVAGSFSKSGDVTRSLLDNPITGQHHVVRLDENAYLCAKLADVKVAFTDHGSIRTVLYFWYHYYDVVDSLLKKNVLPHDETSLRHFRNALFFPNDYEETRFQALEIINRTPDNSLILIEIAKILAFREMFPEANEVLSRILIPNPYHTVARTLRAIIFLNRALKSSNIVTADLLFERAIEEGEFVCRNCSDDVEVFSEIALIYWGRAVKRLTFIRQGLDIDRNLVFSDLQCAIDLLKKGMILSPTGADNRCVFWLCNCSALHCQLQEDQKLFESCREMKDRSHIYQNIGQQMFEVMGWQVNETFLTKKILGAIDIYLHSVMSRNYYPNVLFACSTLLWDFCPVLTVGTYRQTLVWLNEAIEKAEKIGKDKIGLYSCGNCYTEFQHHSIFIKKTERIIEKIKEIKFVTEIEDALDEWPLENLIAENDRKDVEEMKLTLLELSCNQQ